MRITLDLLQNADQYINPAMDREINLRAMKIPLIENLGATQNHFDAINLSDNDLTRLTNMPPLTRLRALYVANNQISRIAPDFFDGIPELNSLVLSGNKLTALVDLEPLFKMKNIERLSLQDNPVTSKSHYRYYVIYKSSKTLRFLDFQRIKDKERKAADALFSGDRGAQLLIDIAPAKKVVEEEPEAKGNEETIAAIKAAILSATTSEEVSRLERALRTGEIPEDLLKPKEGEDKKDEEKPTVNGTEEKPDEPMDTA